MGKKSRRTPQSQQQQKLTKSPADRARETRAIAAKLASLGLTAEYPEIAIFLKTAAEYVDDGASRSGRLPIGGTGRVLVYALTTQPHLTCTATLQAG